MKKQKIPKATHEGILKISGFEIKSYNLDNGDRVLSRLGFIKALGRTGKAKGGRIYDKEFGLPVFLTAKNLKPFISKELIENSTPVIFIDLKGNESIGYKAELLPSVCYVFLDAFEKDVLSPTQYHIAERSKILVRGFATVGIIALIDECTGYQDIRARNELHLILEAYISDKLLSWAKTFPDEFYKEIFRLRGWDYYQSRKKPQIVGKLTNQIVYEKMNTDVLKELQRINPTIKSLGRRRHKQFQWLTEDIGNPHLKAHLQQVIVLMRVSANWKKFISLLNRAFPEGQQIELIPDEDE